MQYFCLIDWLVPLQTRDCDCKTRRWRQHQRLISSSRTVTHRTMTENKERAAEQHAHNYRTDESRLSLCWNIIHWAQALISDGLIIFTQTCLILQRHKSTDQRIIWKHLWIWAQLWTKDQLCYSKLNVKCIYCMCVEWCKFTVWFQNWNINAVF